MQPEEGLEVAAESDLMEHGMVMASYQLEEEVTTAAPDQLARSRSQTAQSTATGISPAKSDC